MFQSEPKNLPQKALETWKKLRPLDLIKVHSNNPILTDDQIECKFDFVMYGGDEIYSG